ncbi:hypothetical protein FHS04_002811 [Mesoflavibacter sabulilitoris]|uniref:Uncharacterized protein n=1 Tax=Mesoflavibacter zeaxanthinifaciens subsp. sabulilitoris TaxID=1520893 RepID=A0A2T1NNN3_9FLAO|nr:hypothetical protein [Mesoflavibacter zeaxanthinifaciens]MBB3125267.1 hypothetical protein [Mesoflavibacter zeaxanthinifaciens subsp. sabulilitoris]PSG94502.1 hypothetical protein C7H61_00785 [Mesoflavibacter zeaxanthinifaciens subsp. sabulilitoris]
MPQTLTKQSTVRRTQSVSSNPLQYPYRRTRQPLELQCQTKTNTELQYGCIDYSPIINNVVSNALTFFNSNEDAFNCIEIIFNCFPEFKSLPVVNENRLELVVRNLFNALNTNFPFSNCYWFSEHKTLKLFNTIYCNDLVYSIYLKPIVTQHQKFRKELLHLILGFIKAMNCTSFLDDNDWTSSSFFEMHEECEQDIQDFIDAKSFIKNFKCDAFDLAINVFNPINDTEKQLAEIMRELIRLNRFDFSQFVHYRNLDDCDDYNCQDSITADNLQAIEYSVIFSYQEDDYYTNWILSYVNDLMNNSAMDNHLYDFITLSDNGIFRANNDAILYREYLDLTQTFNDYITSLLC